VVCYAIRYRTARYVQPFDYTIMHLTHTFTPASRINSGDRLPKFGHPL
jgi:hypothetical protein